MGPFFLFVRKDPVRYRCGRCDAELSAQGRFGDASIAGNGRSIANVQLSIGMLQRLRMYVEVVAVLCWAMIGMCGGELSFNGVYRADAAYQADDVPSAFLIKKSRFLASSVSRSASSNRLTSTTLISSESAMNAVLRVTCPSCITMLTRDFLDYYTESLSSTIEHLQPSQREVANHLARSMKKTIQNLKASATTVAPADPRLNATVAVLVYNGDLMNRVSSRMRLIFFQATFWSVYRSHRSIVVVTKNAGDSAAVRELRLPVLQQLQVNASVLLQAGQADYRTRVQLTHLELIKQSLGAVGRAWQADRGWDRYSYLYFTLSDQLLHSRRASDVYDALDIGVEGNFVMVPHSLLTLPIAQSLPEGLQTALFPDTTQTVGAAVALRERSPQWLPGAHIHTESALHPAGSCCEEGRFLLPACGDDPQARVAAGAGGERGNSTQSAGDGGAATAGVLDQLYHEKDEQRRATRGVSGGNSEGGRNGAARVTPSKRWSYCAQWGTRNFSDWLRFGERGFAMPTVTAGLSYCTYTTVARQCPLPKSAKQQQLLSGAQPQEDRPARRRSGTADAVDAAAPADTVYCDTSEGRGRMPASNAELAHGHGVLRGSGSTGAASIAAAAGVSGAAYNLCGETPLLRVDELALGRLRAQDVQAVQQHYPRTS